MGTFSHWTFFGWTLIPFMFEYLFRSDNAFVIPGSNPPRAGPRQPASDQPSGHPCHNDDPVICWEQKVSFKLNFRFSGFNLFSHLSFVRLWREKSLRLVIHFSQPKTDRAVVVVVVLLLCAVLCGVWWWVSTQWLFFKGLKIFPPADSILPVPLKKTFRWKNSRLLLLDSSDTYLPTYR